MTNLLCTLGWHSRRKVYVSTTTLTAIYCPTCGKLTKEIKHGLYY